MSNKTINIAIFPSEAENAFELYRSLRYAPRFNVIGLSNRRGSNYFQFEHNREGVPLIDEKNFLSEFSRILMEENIQFIFPTHDTVALFLKENEYRIPAQVLCSRVETTHLCRDKKLMYAFLQNETFCPTIYSTLQEIPHFPVFLKPADGQGGQGCKIAHNAEELSRAIEQNPAILMCEYLPGEEYTLDCFTDRHGNLLFVGPRSRDVVKMGMAFASSSFPLTQEMEGIASLLSRRLSMRGLWFFQLKLDSFGTLKLLEVSTRVAGTMSLYRQLGINFAQLAIYDALDMDVTILNNNVPIRLNRTIHTCYSMDIHYETIYIDLDDTLIIRDNVNLQAITFLYQCVNLGKKIILITRHDGELIPYLSKFRIPHVLFDDIIQISNGSNKSLHINKESAIFIDNLFLERKEVKETLNIPVFDVDALDSLLSHAFTKNIYKPF